MRSITFEQDDLQFINSLEGDTQLEGLVLFLKEVFKKVAVGNTINIEMERHLISMLPIAENKWEDDDRIINHLAIQFYHNT